MKQTPKEVTFDEAYEVSLDYRKSDGYWVMNHKHQVMVKVKHGVNEKNNHAEAMEIARKHFPGCRINGAGYA